ncbi:hypothetical protein QP835_11320 [Pseudomonas oryzihabitans]|uniref:hypothetical protein n=1 Tax=Pseudomonas oryzihabitans TaxID=47885 RepID=UPI002553C2D0|nr:hypothetical protein [Pseudomonas oryzihabitans]MDK8264866.1 hypothetical protein [Pseudomonas oryzihabitans]
MNHQNAVRPCAEADALKLVQSLRALDAKRLLQSAIERGLTFGDCTNAFGVTREESAFVRAAQVAPDDDIEFDDLTVVARSERGAFVHCWHFVPNAAAGIPEPSVMLEELLRFASSIEQPQSMRLQMVRGAMAQVMEAVEDELDQLEGVPCEVSPMRIEFGPYALDILPSALVIELVSGAKAMGFSGVLAEALLNWIDYQGNLLDQLAAEMFVAAA